MFDRKILMSKLQETLTKKLCQNQVVEPKNKTCYSTYS
jgi:hypothetical protein